MPPPDPNPNFPLSVTGCPTRFSFSQGEKNFTSIDLIRDLSSMNFPQCNFPPRVSHTFCIFHIERMYKQLYHCSFSIPSYSFKEKKRISFTIFFFLSFAGFFFLIVSYPSSWIIFLKFFFFLYNSTLCRHVLVLVINYYIIYL